MSGGTIELRSGTTDGELLDSNTIQPNQEMGPQILDFDLSKFENKHDLYLVFKSSDEGKPAVGITHLHFKS
jgi:hypothetical protein